MKPKPWLREDERELLFRKIARLDDLQLISPRDLEIFARREGLKGWSVESTTDLAARFRLSRSRVSQILHRVFRHITWHDFSKYCVYCVQRSPWVYPSGGRPGRLGGPTLR